jgi:glycosyltransferase involved in cell wall biosynthesis
MNTPSISTIIPVRNGAAYIADAIASIEQQVVPVTEILIVDDGSTDATQDIVARLSGKNPVIKLLEGPGKGPGPARNVALAVACGEIIAFLDADDLWPANKLELQLARINRDPHVDVVSGFVRYFDKQAANGLVPASDSRTVDIFHVHLGAAVYHRSIFEQLGNFQEGVRYSEDVDLLLRVREAGIPMTILRRITLYYRRHTDAMTTTVTHNEVRDFNSVIMQSILRRRAAGITAPLEPFSNLIEN